MATTVHLPIDEYLNTYYRPDREYIDGEVVERTLGTWDHGRIQALLIIWFGKHEAQWNVMVASEWRARVSPTRIRIPDVTIVYAGPQPRVLDVPPVLVIEILSPDDTSPAVERKVDDYTKMGVDTIWVIDPEAGTARTYRGTTWNAVTRLEVPGTPIYLDLPTLLTDLRQRR